MLFGLVYELERDCPLLFMVNFSIITLDFVAEIAQIHGHMGLKMIHKMKADKILKYNNLTC